MGRRIGRLYNRPTQSSGVTVPTTMKRLALADALSVNDPNSRLSTALTDDGAGITASITGGWSTTNPLEGAYVVWNVKDVTGANFISTTAIFSIFHEIIERTAAGLSSDVAVVMGLMNEDTDSATVDAPFVGISYSGATRRITHGRLENDVITVAHTNTVQIRIVGNTFSKGGNDADAGVTCQRAFSILNAAGTDLNTSTSLSAFADGFGLNYPRLFLAFYRTATTAGTEVSKVDCHYNQPCPTELVI